jgi:hypothetical protein
MSLTQKQNAMHSLQPEVLAIWAILLLALTVAIVLFVRPIRQCIDCESVCSLFSGLLCLVSTVFQGIICIVDAVFRSLLSSFLADLYATAKTVIQALPLAWYSMAILTVTPICFTIPRSGAVLFLFVYCMAGLLVCSVEPRKRKIDKPEPAALDSEYFMGMRIKIELN